MRRGGPSLAIMTRWLFAWMLLTGLGTTAAYGQNEEDAVRFSSYLPGGTARSWALGSAMGAVGADPSSISLNPAGMALYNTSEFSITPQFEVNSAKATHYGSGASDTDNKFSFNNLSLILSTPSVESDKWVSTTFGISFDRQASYHWEQRAHGSAVPSTILQMFVNEADGTAPGNLASDFPFTSDLAWESYGINLQDSASNAYYSSIPYGIDVDQDHRISSSGRLNTTSFFYSANLRDRVYLGAAMGLAAVRFERQTVHAEQVLDPSEEFSNLSYREKLLTTGSGVDLKIGVLGRVGDRLRLGLAFHSPKWLQLSDLYSYQMDTRFRTPDAEGNYTYGKDSPTGNFDYRIRTPWKLLASAAYIVGQHGLFSVDYSYSDYRQTRLGQRHSFLDDYDFSMENQAVTRDLRAAHSVRAGTEWRTGAWYFRAGWGIWPDAYDGTDARHGTAYKRYTAGVGYRARHISIDLAMVHGTRDTKYFPYAQDLVQPINATLSDTRGMLTLAFRP